MNNWFLWMPLVVVGLGVLIYVITAYTDRRDNRHHPAE
jgi:hypothetical protein